MTTDTIEDVAPATALPRDAKPSELVRGWPESRWCRGQYTDGRGSFCAIGLLAEMAGFTPQTVGCTWGFVSDYYGIPESLITSVYSANDQYGKDAAADVLEQAGY